MSYNPLEFNDQARIWVYQADRKLLEEEVIRMQPLIDAFCRQWTAHQQQLKAGGRILNKRFLLIAVDETDALASGCSIDKSIHFLRELQAEFGLDWFNRLDIAAETNTGEVFTFPLSGFEELLEKRIINESTRIYNHTLQDLGSWKTSWKEPLAQSWLAHRYQRWSKSKEVRV
jgi:hypothetical protein